jgi:hypothetical protein
MTFISHDLEQGSRTATIPVEFKNNISRPGA